MHGKQALSYIAHAFIIQTIIRSPCSSHQLPNEHAGDGGPARREGFCAVLKAGTDAEIATVVQALASVPAPPDWEAFLQATENSLATARKGEQGSYDIKGQ